MQTLLADIECDMLELKSLLQMAPTGGSSAMRRAVGRCIRRMRAGLDELEARIGELPAVQEGAPDAHEGGLPPKETPVADDSAKVAGPEHQAAVPILAECIRPAADLRHAFSLNDRFRFTKELFGGDAAQMDEAVQRISEAASLQEALDVVMSGSRLDESNEAVADFAELLKKYFK